MKKKYIILLMALLSVGSFCSCSSDEDTTPSLADANGFAPNDDDNSEEANLRREFYKQTGCYLLFNDTLSVKNIGTDYYGQPIRDVQMVNVDFDSFNSGVDVYRYTYSYIKDVAKQKKAAQFLKENVLDRLGTVRPYSVLLVNGISQWSQNEYGEWQLTEDDDYYGTTPHPTYRLGTRCYVFSIENSDALDDPTFFESVLCDIVKDKISSKGKTFLADFKALVENYDQLTGRWDSKDEMGYPLGKNDDLARSLGFLNDWNKYFFPNETTDINDYINAVFSYSLEDFSQEYAQYPICIARFKLMREKIEGLGVVIK